MKIMLIGGAGFIGSHVANILISQGHDVSIVDNFSDYNVFDVDDMHALYNKRLNNLTDTAQLYVQNITDFAGINDRIVTVSPDVIIHLAAYPNARLVNSNPYEARTVMISGLQNALYGAVFAGVRRFVFISSSMVYGDFAQGVTEDAPTAPKGLYAELKLEGEQVVKNACKEEGMEYTIVRPIAVYGPYDTPDRVAAKFLSAAIHGDPIIVQGADQILDLTYVTDTANGIALAATKDIAADQTYNISLGEGYQLSKVAVDAADVTHSCSPIHCTAADPAYPTRNTMSNAKAREELGFAPTVTLHNGLTSYAEWLNQNPIFRS